MIILGLDPGSRFTGIGLVGDHGLIHAETLKLGGGPMPERLGMIHARVGELIAEYGPGVAAVESVFVSRNPQSAIKLGQARGAAIAAAVHAGVEVHEYTPAAVKQAIVGRGRADKAQVAHMVGVLLGIRETLSEDAADALAVALCHRHTAATAARLPAGVVLR